MGNTFTADVRGLRGPGLTGADKAYLDDAIAQADAAVGAAGSKADKTLATPISDGLMSAGDKAKLANVDGTRDVDKPVSAAQATAIAAKADKAVEIKGKGLARGALTLAVGGEIEVVRPTLEQARAGTATDVAMTPADVTAHLQDRKDKPNGVAGLTAGGKLPSDLIPAPATFGAATQEALNAQKQRVDAAEAALVLKADTAALDAASVDLAAVRDRVATAEDALDQKAERRTPLQTQGRPGDAVERFTSTLPGAAEDGEPVVGEIVRDATTGAALYVTGPGIVALRERVALEPTRIYELVYAVRRVTDTSDPVGDGVRIAVRWLTGQRSAAGGRTLSESALSVADGRVTARVVIAAAAGAGIDHAWPASARYAVPYVQLFGGTGVTAIELVDWSDVTAVVEERRRADDTKLSLGGDQAMQAPLPMGGFAITDLAVPAEPHHAANKQYVDVIAEAEAEAAANVVAFSLRRAGVEVIGRPAERPPVGNTAFDNVQYLFQNPFIYAGSVDRLTFKAKAAGLVHFSIWRRGSANDFTQVREFIFTGPSAGDYILENGDASGFAGLSHDAGEYVGFYGPNVLMFTAGAAPDGPGLFGGAGRGVPFTAGPTFDTVRAELRVESNYTSQVLSAHEIDALRPVPLPLPAEFYMFTVAGQSNSVGYSDAPSPEVPVGVAYFWNGTSMVPLADPVGTAQNGSWCAAFAREFWERTGFGCMFVPTGKGSTSLVTAANTDGGGTWSSTGTLRAASVAATKAAMGAVGNALPWQYGGIIWCQGEQDAGWIASYGGDQASYIAEFGLLNSYFKSEFGASVPVIISRTGQRPDQALESAWQQIRNAQDYFARTYSNVSMGFTGAITFVARGLMQTGSLHYRQPGYDLMGRALARVAAQKSVGSM